MTITPRGGGPLVVATTANPVSGTLTGAQQPQSGDLLVIIHGNDYYAITDMPTPTVGGSTSGVGAISNGTADAGSLFAHIKSYTYVVGSTGDLTVSVTESGLGDEEKVLTVYVLSGADTATPVDIAGNNATTTPGTSHVCPSVNATTSDGFMILHTNDGNGSNGGPYSWPGGTTEQYDGNVASSMSYTGATEQLASSGATGTRTATGTGGSSYAAVTIVIRTAAAGGTPVDAPPANVNGPAPGLGLPNSFPVPWAGSGFTADTQAAAEAASGTASAADASAAVAPNAEATAATGAANAAAADLQANAGSGAATGSAADPSADAQANAQASTASGAAADASADIRVNAEAAAATGTASDATVSTSSNTNAPAEAATATGSAGDATALLAASSEAAAAAAAAQDPQAVLTVPAGQPAATGTAGDPLTAVQPDAALASGSGSAFDAVIVLVANAEVATAIGAANAPTVNIGGPGTANAGVATATGTAYNATTHRAIPRPTVGSTARPGSGTILRPNSGATERP